MLTPYKTAAVEVEEKVVVRIWNDELANNPDNEKHAGKHMVETPLKKGDVIELELYDTMIGEDRQHVALFKIYPADGEKALDLSLTDKEDILHAAKGRRVTKKLLKTESAVFSASILNKKVEDFFTDKENYGGFFTSNGSKIIQLFVSDEMMSQQDFEDACLLLLNKTGE